MSRRRGFVFPILILLSSLVGAAGVPIATGDDFQQLLSAMHPDYTTYIGAIRTGSTRFHPVTLYMGLVREGGKDPTLPEDAPLIGRGVKNDVVVYADSREAGRSDGWAMLLIDHEYFHARHLARGDNTPVPSFGSPEVDRHFYEAAWGTTWWKPRRGGYPTLTHADYLKPSGITPCTSNPSGLHPAPITMRAHYRRFLPEPGTLERTVLARNSPVPLP